MEERQCISVRPERVSDFGAIDRLVSAAFKSPVQPKLVRLIRESPDYVPALSLVAEVDGKIVGHIMLSHLELDDGHARHRVLTLSPVAVEPDAQNRGVGGTLIRTALRAADDLGEQLVVLEGSPRYYPRFGFKPASELGVSIDLPEWAPLGAAQVFPLSNYDPQSRGHVIYPSAFTQAESEG